MILKSLSLLNYKNIDSNTFNFDDKINCFVGPNGIGKTNILDAIYHLSFGKSYFNPVAVQNIKHGEEFFVIEGNYEKSSRQENIIISLKKGQKKLIKRNAKAYEKFSEHIGFLPLVIISPADRNLILEGSDVRRKFIDGVISQSNKSYLKDLIDYNKILVQRNSLLKYFSLNNVYNEETLSIYNQQMSKLGTSIFKRRDEFLMEFIPIFEHRYNGMSEGKESVSIEYKSDLHDNDLNDLLEESVNKDRALQYTSVGIHKDDLVFNINNHSIKKFGSQGQQKTFLIALKLAQFDFIKDHSGKKPILLLDDIFDKLDRNRVAQLIKLVNDKNFGQIFISDTHEERSEEVIKQTHQTYKIFKL